MPWVPKQYLASLKLRHVDPRKEGEGSLRNWVYFGKLWELLKCHSFKAVIQDEYIQDNNTILANTKNQTKLLRSKDLGITAF